MIKAVIFDYFGVICSNEYWHEVMRHDPGHLRRDLAHQVSLGNLDWRQFVQRMAEETGTPIETMEKLFKTEQIDP